MEAFVYCWTDFGTNKLYVGVHKGTPDDGYVCSSKIMKEEYFKRPEDFSREILATGDWPMMYQLETSLLSALQADKDPGFYNQHLNSGTFYQKGPIDSETKKKISLALKGRPLSPETITKLSAAHMGRPPWNKGKKGLQSGKDNPFYGKTHSPISIVAMSVAHMGNTPWNKGKQGLQVGWNKGIKTGPQSPEHIVKRSGRIPWNKGLKGK
jgi:hypothetical protein